MIIEQEQVRIAEMYQAGTGYTRIAKVLGYPRRQVRQAIINQGVKIKKPKGERYKVDETAFDCIDNELAAYWLGFIYADGCVTGNDLRIDLNKRDEQHLEKICPFLKTKRPLWHSRQRPSKVLFKVGNRHLAQRLQSLGILPDRPNVNFAISQVPEQLYHHFIRGYFDGDGSAGRKQKRIRLCGQVDILSWTKDVLCSNTCAEGAMSIRPYKHTDKIVVIAFCGNNMIEFRNYIYKDATIWMKRKREKADRW